MPAFNRSKPAGRATRPVTMSVGDAVRRAIGKNFPVRSVKRNGGLAQSFFSRNHMKLRRL